jgi:uncharacterized protein (TIGR02271 family)
VSSTDPTQRDLDARGTDLHRDSVVRHEEELAITRQTQQIGTVRVDKHVETTSVSERVDRDVEHADMERVAAGEGDSGLVETLADGSVSIPVFEEELVITKRRVLRERIIVRKRVVTEQETVQADLLRERVEVDVQGDIDVDGLTRGG